jgi:hypothetical protein
VARLPVVLGGPRRGRVSDAEREEMHKLREEGWPYQDIGDRLGWSYATIKYRLNPGPQRQWWQNYRERHPDRIRTHTRLDYHDRQVAHLCILGGCQDPPVTKRLCQRHREMYNRWAREEYTKRKETNGSNPVQA